MSHHKCNQQDQSAQEHEIKSQLRGLNFKIRWLIPICWARWTWAICQCTTKWQTPDTIKWLIRDHRVKPAIETMSSIMESRVLCKRSQIRKIWRTRHSSRIHSNFNQTRLANNLWLSTRSQTLQRGRNNRKQIAKTFKSTLINSSLQPNRTKKKTEETKSKQTAQWI